MARAVKTLVTDTISNTISPVGSGRAARAGAPNASTVRQVSVLTPTTSTVP